MSSASAFGARLEERTATLLGGKRVRRANFGVRASDLETLVLPSGERCIVECKARRRIPQVVTRALAQAKGYDASATPVAVIRAKGKQPVVCIPLAAFARIAGIQPHEAPVQNTFTKPCVFCTALREIA